MQQSPHKMAKHLATYITDKTAIASHLIREFGVQYGVRDVERMLSLGQEPAPPTLTQTLEPIAWSKPLQTAPKGYTDLLAEATNAYLARNANKIREALASGA